MILYAEMPLFSKPLIVCPRLVEGNSNFMVLIKLIVAVYFSI